MKKLVLISVLFLFVSINFSYASDASSLDKEQSVTVLEAGQNQVPIFGKVKTKVKKWFSNKKEQVNKIIPLDINKKQGVGLAIALVVIGLLLFIGGMLPIAFLSLGIIDIIIFGSMSILGIIL